MGSFFAKSTSSVIVKLTPAADPNIVPALIIGIYNELGIDCELSVLVVAGIVSVSSTRTVDAEGPAISIPDALISAVTVS